jgi:hypothetical protein
VYNIDIIKDVWKEVDYLKVRLVHHVKIFFWWGGGDRNQTIT